MPVCDKCGEKIMVGARMCIYCGAEVENPICPVPPVRRDQNRTLMILLACAIVVAVLLLVVLLAVLTREESKPASALQELTLPERVTVAVVTQPTAGVTDPTDPPAPTDPVVKIPCTAINVDETLTLGRDLPTMQLSFSTEPIDTTDEVEFASSDPKVATVDSKGRVTAIGTGSAIIRVTCGDISEICVVTCYMDEVTPDEEPMPELRLRLTDCSFNYKGYQWRAFERTEGFDETKFTWTMDDENIATVKDGFVTSVAPGKTTLRVYYQGEQVASCIIRCNWTEEPEVPDDPENPDDPVDPPAEVKHEIRIDNLKPAYLYNNQENSAEVTQAVGHKIKLTLVDKELGLVMNDVVWTISDESVCKLDGNYVVGLKKGTCKITCEYNGVTYLVFVRVTN